MSSSPSLRAPAKRSRPAASIARNIGRAPLSTADVEAVLARLYSDKDFLARFLSSPDDVLAHEPLTITERAALAALDRSELILAANSYGHKRESRAVLRR